MLIISFFTWWYGRGFKDYLARFADQTKNLVDFFSLKLIVRNLFAPFRQIAVMKGQNMPLSARIHAWGDLMVSRFVGSVVRIVILIAGMIALLARAVIGIAMMVLWPLMPLLVVYSIMLYARGVVF